MESNFSVIITVSSHRRSWELIHCPSSNSLPLLNIHFHLQSSRACQTRVPLTPLPLTKGRTGPWREESLYCPFLLLPKRSLFHSFVMEGRPESQLESNHTLVSPFKEMFYLRTVIDLQKKLQRCKVFPYTIPSLSLIVNIPYNYVLFVTTNEPVLKYY